MHSHLRLLGCFVAACCLLVSSARAEFTAVTGWERQLFPSYIIATASMRAPAEATENTLGDPRGLLGVTVESPAAGVPIKVSIESDEILQTSEFSGTLPQKGTTYRIFPKIKFRYQSLAKFDQATSVSVTYRVKIGKAAEEEQTVTLLVRSINDCPFVVAAGDEHIDTSFTFAAYVNEQHPFVDKLLREALDIGMVEKFNGYQSGNQAEVIQQVYALWDLLVARDVRYSSITTTAANAETVASQHVRLLEDTVNNSQANCVDGSVLFVSLLRKIGIDAFLVMEPGHCYAAFFADAKKTTCYAIETTLLGDEIELAEGAVPAEFDEAIGEDDRDEDTFASFVTAVKTGTARFVKNGKRFKDEQQTRYRIIDIAAARAHGILPIAFQGKQEFVAFDHSERYADTEDPTEDDSTDDDTDDEDE